MTKPSLTWADLDCPPAARSVGPPADVDTELVLKIRAASPGDELGVARVHVLGWQVAYRGLIAQDYLNGLRPEDKARKYSFDRAAADMPVTLIAVDEEDVIYGFATTGRSHDSDLPDLGEVWAIYVDPPYWGRGVGRLLMDASRDQLRRDGAREALMWVLAGNERARRFYEIGGWWPDGARRMEIFGDSALEEVRYRCAL
jgi:GNAT superfamily N-acetyltransferase